MSNLDQEKRLKEFTNQDLLRSIQGRQINQIKVNETKATRTLLSRNKGRSTAVAAEVLKHQRTPEARIAAIQSLGHAIDPSAQKVLVSNLGSRDRAELRSTIWSLGKIGNADAFKKLSRVNLNGHEPLKEAVEGAKRLLAFRNGITGMEFDVRKLAKVAKIPTNTGQKMEIARIPTEILARHATHMKTEVPGISLTQKSVVALTCLRKQLWLVNAAETETDLKLLLKRPNIPMAIFGYAHCSERPYLHAYVYAQPSAGGAKLFVTRLRGQTTHAGTLKIEGNDVNFELSALTTRFSPAAFIAGTMKRGGTLNISNAKVSNDLSRVAKLRRTPKLVTLAAGIRPDQIGTKDKPNQSKN